MRGDVDRVNGPADARARMPLGSLNAPGVDFTRYTPVAPETDDRVSQLAQLFGAASVATGAVVGAVAQEQANTERLQRGDAARRAAEQWPGLEAKIRDGSLLPPDGSDPVEWARGIATVYAPEDAAPAYLDEIERRLVPLVTESAIRKQEQIREDSREALMRTLGDGLTGHTDPAAFSAAVDQAVAMGVDRDKAIASLGLGAAAFAAEAGETEAFETAVAFLGGRERLRTEQLGNRLQDDLDRTAARADADAARAERKAEQERSKIEQLRNQLERTVAKQQAELERFTTERFDSMVLDVMDPSSGRTYDDLRDMVGTARSTVGDSWALSRVRQINEMEAGEQARVLKIHTEQTNAATRSAILDRAVEMSFRTDTTPGLVGIPDDGVEWTDPSGKVQTLTAKEIRQATTAAAMDRIAKADPATAFPRQADWLASNSETNPEWTSTLVAGQSAATAAFNRRDARGQVPQELPPNVANAFAMSKQLRAQDPTLWAKHLPADAQLFWLRAETAEQFIHRGDPLAAIQQATVVPDGPTVDRIREEDLDGSIASFVGSDVVNSQDVRGHVRMVAGLLMASPGLGKQQAMAEATKLVSSQYRQINKAMVNVGNARVPEAIQPVAESIVSKYADYVRNSPFEVDADDLTLVPLRDSDQWVLFDTSRNRPVDKWAHGYVFTNGELQAMSREAAKAASTERATAVQRAWQALQNPSSGEAVAVFDTYDSEFMESSARVHARAKLAREQRRAAFEAERRRDPINP
jgi:hypothetical protein